MSNNPQTHEAGGAGPFRTWRLLVVGEETVVWLARNHRKGVGKALAPRAAWQTPGFNIAIAIGFCIGSALFVLGSILSLFPALVLAPGIAGPQANLIYFIGSIFFTISAYLQLFQAANAGTALHGATAPPMRAAFGWRPQDPGWLSAATQFAGTLLFNVNTYDALVGGGSRLHQDLTIWGPDMLGSVLFLVSGYFALLETCHTWWSWQPRSLAWWIVTVNFTGCVAFMISAILAFVPLSGPVPLMVELSIWFTLSGGLCFFIGAALSIPESFAGRDGASEGAAA